MVASGRTAFWLLTLLCVGWMWFIGTVSAGHLPNLTAWLFVCVPVACLLLVFACARSIGAAGRMESCSLIVFCVAALLLVRQPWNPRNNFVTTLHGISIGATKEQAMNVMRAYSFSGTHEAGSNDVGATHVLSYQWNKVDGNYNADFGRVLLANDKVVGLEFSPD